jgi:hypothetical protein
MGLVTDVFTQNAWGVVDFQENVVERTDYVPSLLGQLGLFTPIYSRNRAIAIATKNKTMTLIPTSANGAPPEELIPEGAQVKLFQTNRLAKGSTIYAAELAGTTALPFDVQTKEISDEVAMRAESIMDDLNMTWEHQRLGALMGIVYDADGTTVLHNWYTEWGIAEPAEVNFELDNPETDVRKKCRDIGRAMQNASKGIWRPNSRIGALVGDTFFDSLVDHPSIKETRVGTERAVTLENIGGYSSVEIENITFINYRGSDDGNLSVGTDTARFFPMNTPGAFQVGFGPADEFKPYLNQRGREVVGLVLEDKSGRDAWDRVEMYSYPLFIATRPEMLQRARGR